MINASSTTSLCGVKNRARSRLPTRRLLAALTMTALALCSALFAASPASANSGVNIVGWCRWYYNSPYFNAVVVANNVYGWRCQYGTDQGTRLNVDMNGACHFTHSASPGSATFTNYSNPYSWYCIF